MKEKIVTLCRLITLDQQDYLKKRKLDCQVNLDNAVAHYKEGRKYINIDVGRAGKYMVEKSTSIIYGIKAYGVIHRGYSYGTLNTINDYYWGDYRASKKETAK